MEDTLLRSLSISEKADHIRKYADFIEEHDFYSFFVHVYMLDQQEYKLYYDFSGLLVSVESENETSPEGAFVASQIADSLENDDL